MTPTFSEPTYQETAFAYELGGNPANLKDTLVLALILFALFVGVPLIEIWLFITLGQQIGLFATLALVIVTAMAGTALLRAQGLAVLAKAQSHMNKAEMPLEEVFTGVFLLVAGALLLTPGFFTDALGFLLFVPSVRRWVGKTVFEWLMKRGKVRVHTAGFGPRPRGPGVIDGDFEDVGPDDRDPPRQGGGRIDGPSGWQNPPGGS